MDDERRRRETAGLSCWFLFAVFLFTLGERTEEQFQRNFAPRFLFVMLKRRLRIVPPVPAFRLTPIRVREKRMNTYKTAKTRWSYQNINKINM
ncbi:MAG TPA: hypothetical protein VGR76_11015 [Candidatus Angelobacter sp.]|nr:hypothetical protein [Candidatus Angelobacter sp.]